jgi:hypothetical protein
MERWKSVCEVVGIVIVVNCAIVRASVVAMARSFDSLLFFFFCKGEFLTALVRRASKYQNFE